MRRLSWIVTIPLALLLISFALSNRGRVDLQLWPFNWTLSAPFFLVVLLAALIGFLLGGFLVWMQNHGARRAARRHAARVRVLEAEVARLRERLEQAEPRVLTAPQPPAQLPG